MEPVDASDVELKPARMQGAGSQRMGAGLPSRGEACGIMLEEVSKRRGVKSQGRASGLAIL